MTQGFDEIDSQASDAAEGLSGGNKQRHCWKTSDHSPYGED